MRSLPLFVICIFIFSDIFAESKDFFNIVSINENQAGRICATGLMANHSCDSIRYQWQVDQGNGSEAILDSSRYDYLDCSELIIFPGNAHLNGNVYRCLALTGNDTIYSHPIALIIERSEIETALSSSKNPIEITQNTEEDNEEEEDWHDVPEFPEFLGLENDTIEFADLSESETSQEIKPQEVVGKETEAISIQANWLDTPIEGMVVTSDFKARRNCKGCSKTHAGTDYDAPKNTSVAVTADGEVVKSCYSASYGHHVIVYHGTTKDGRKIYTLYAHGTERKVKSIHQVKKGEEILLSGSTGYSTDYHLHYEVIATKHAITHPKFYSDLRTRYGADELGELLDQM